MSDADHEPPKLVLRIPRPRRPRFATVLALVGAVGVAYAGATFYLLVDGALEHRLWEFAAGIVLMLSPVALIERDLARREREGDWRPWQPWWRD